LVEGYIMKNEKLCGVFAPVITPFVNGEVAYDRLRSNIEKLNGSGLKGYVVLGSNGEFASLAPDERKKVVPAVKEASRNKVLAVGSGCESTKETVEFTDWVCRQGVDFVFVITPHYFGKRMTDEALINHYRVVADNSKVPVLLYNAPEFTGVTISAEAVRSLSAHPNIAGMKDSSPANLISYIEAANPDFNILAGSVNFFFTGLLMGAVGGVLSLANVLPDVCCELYDQAIKGRLEEGRALQLKLLALNRAVSGKFGVAGVKAAMDIAGYYGGEPRLPLLPLSAEEKKALRQKFLDSGLWRKR
jgi:4-hydroxy-2-oxoglutarate aldolase